MWFLYISVIFPEGLKYINSTNSCEKLNYKTWITYIFLSYLDCGPRASFVFFSVVVVVFSIWLRNEIFHTDEDRDAITHEISEPFFQFFIIVEIRCPKAFQTARESHLLWDQAGTLSKCMHADMSSLNQKTAGYL